MIRKPVAAAVVLLPPSLTSVAPSSFSMLSARLTVTEMLALLLIYCAIVGVLSALLHHWYDSHFS